MNSIEQLNADWLAAWTAQDAERVASFYTEDTRYFDALVPDGIVGRDALRKRLAALFERTPPMRYEPDVVWPIEGGFCGRWICTIEAGELTQMLRGFDLVLLRDGRIAHNEVYTHPIQKDFRAGPARGGAGTSGASGR